MALYDNKYWLLSHIRNSFITTDDTGMCEMVMVGESKQVQDKFFSKEPFPDLDESDEDDDDDADNSPRKSGLSSLIKQFTNLPLNPFMEFAKFDGSGQINIPTRKYRIYLTMLPEEQRNYPLNVCCIATAKVQELIGLILLKCSTTYAEYPLKPVLNYGLYITEEDGEVDSDFPNLDPKECVAKFGFTCLGLVEHNETQKSVSFERTDEVPSSPDSGEGKKRTLSASKEEEKRQFNKDMKIMDGHNKAMEAPLYRSYRVHIANKLWWWNIDVLLGISSEKIEIDPITQKNSKLQLVKQAPVSHPMDSIAWCEETETRGNKSTFRVVYSSGFGSGTGSTERANFYDNTFSLSSPLQSSPSFKHYDFEAEREVAEEIVNKINLILNLRSSQSRRDYLAAKERKHFSKRKSFKYLKS